MKIKHDFVTNSSSTSFIFTFKDNVKEVYDNIKKHSKEFELTYNGFNSTANDVVAAMKMFEKTKHVRDIDGDIEMLNDELVGYKDDGFVDWSWRIDDIKRELAALELAKINGAKNPFAIEFGDNHGDIRGMGLGETMDYEGRFIRINDKDFQVFTEQNR